MTNSQLYSQAKKRKSAPFYMGKYTPFTSDKRLFFISKIGTHSTFL